VAVATVEGFVRRFAGRNSFVFAVALGANFISGGALAQALPFLAPGDSALRHMVDLDADSGQIPLSTTWPLPTFDLPTEERDKLRGYNLPGSASDAGWFMSGASNPTKLRTFSDTPRENGEAGLQAGWAAGDYAGGAIRMSYEVKPQDGMHYRFDSTYLAYRLGNWWITAGEPDRWWGPGWDSSLILSTNARPMPGLGLERASSLAPEWKMFRWVGPWRLVTFIDHMENHRADFDNTLFWGARLTFQPLHGVEIGLSRTAEFCGSGHACGLGTFWDMLIAKSNRAINSIVDANPSQVALLTQKESAQVMAIDVRWHIDHAPLAFYWQQLGEVFDDQDLRPRQTLQLFGTEFAAWDVADGRAHAFLEFADTTCGDISFSSTDKPTFGCAYEKDTWQAGYRYYGRAIGDSMDRDGRRFSLGVIFAGTDGQSWDARIRHFDLNRGGIAEANLVPQSVTTVAERLWNTEIQYNDNWREFRYSVGVGADYGGPITAAHSSLAGRFFLRVSKNW
jgi:hypothetical protein